MKKFLIFAAILFAAYTWQKRVTASSTVSSKYTSHDEVIMYSLTTCGHCKLMAGELQNANIVFTEKFIDTDSDAKTELYSKLAKAGVAPRTIGMPALDVHGNMMPDNPGLAAVRKRL
jgi:glutaredoxin